MRAPPFTVGRLQYHDLIFGETKQWQGIVGNEFLSRHVVTLDFPHGRMFLRPGKEFNRADTYGMSGIAVRRLGHKTIVTITNPKGPGELAGLRDEDVLVQINGKDAESYQLSELRDLLRSKDGAEIDIKYLRDGKVQSATVKLRKEL